MNDQLRIIAITKERFVEVKLAGLTPIGGKNSTGFVIDGLKCENDYAILAAVDDSVSIHPLRGSKSPPATLHAGQILKIDDLTLMVENSKQKIFTNESHSAESIKKILMDMTREANTRKPLEEILQSTLDLCRHQHGLIVSQALNGNYEILVSKNVDASKAWLSENLIQEAINGKEPILLQNVIGSDFDTRQSLIATNFLSVFCWPLVVQGDVVGALITGSPFPHGDSLENAKAYAGAYVNLAALFLGFHLNELRLKLELDSLKREGMDGPFLTDSPIVREVCAMAKKVSSSALSVLIQGETGVGKEVLSRWIHQQSDRKTQPFIAVNCAAIPTELLESALFGHKRGSFTGAVSDHMGKIQQAHNGTLLLDEIGDLSLPLQAKLLRVLQDGIVEPIGSMKSIEVDVRLICASHKDIGRMAQENHFRQDLYYRIAQVTLVIPPLRERLIDVRLLASQFLKEFAPTKRLAQDAWSWLLSQEWPGNVRELKSALQRASVLSSGDKIHARDFWTGSGHGAGSLKQGKMNEEFHWLGADNLEEAKHRFVMQKIEKALQITNGNRTRAAELLGVTSRTLFRYLEHKAMTSES